MRKALLVLALVAWLCVFAAVAVFAGFVFMLAEVLDAISKRIDSRLDALWEGL